MSRHFDLFDILILLISHFGQIYSATKDHMPKNICFYFEVHQPYRVNEPNSESENIFEGPKGDNPIFTYGNYNLFCKAANNCYIPATAMWLKLLQEFPNLSITLSLSGTFLEQCLEYGDIGTQVLNSFRSLVKTGQVELLAETYHHSLSCLLDTEEMIAQIKKHMSIIKELFDYIPKNFRNTELIYNNQVAHVAQKLGFGATVIEDASNDIITKVRMSPPDFFDNSQATSKKELQAAVTNKSLILLTKNYELVSKFFSIRHHATQEMVDLTLASLDNFVGVFTDFEVFGEHNYIGDDVFNKVRSYIFELEKLEFDFLTVEQSREFYQNTDLPVYDCREFISWTNSWHNLVSWRGNEFQEAAFAKLLQTLPQVKLWQDDIAKQSQYQTWQKLTTSDHFYYMSDLPGPDGIVHSSFNAFPSHFEAYQTYIKVLDWIMQQ